MSIFDRNRFIVQPKLKDVKNTGVIMDGDMNRLCYIKHHHSWKSMIITARRMTGILLEGIDGVTLGEIPETSKISWGRMLKKWEIYDANGELKGALMEKPKFIGSHWVLENPKGKEIATIKGNRKKHDYEVLTKDKQVIARCHREATMDKDSYIVDIPTSDFDTFLVLSYIVALDYVSTWRVEVGPSFP